MSKKANSQTARNPFNARLTHIHHASRIFNRTPYKNGLSSSGTRTHHERPHGYYGTGIAHRYPNGLTKWRVGEREREKERERDREKSTLWMNRALKKRYSARCFVLRDKKPTVFGFTERCTPSLRPSARRAPGVTERHTRDILVKGNPPVLIS